MPLLSVIVPTYNEAANVGPLLRELQATLPDVDVEYLVVDDDSRDGTAAAAREAGARVIVRTGERGLATAVVRGLKESRGRYAVVMDADFQHPPSAVRRLLDRAVAKDAELVIGSRYVEGGSEGGFGAVRKAVSRGAGAIAKLALPPVRRFRVTDPMSGLFLVRLDRIDLDALRPTGYKILLEILGRTGLERVEEVGYVFQDRRGGKSKLGAGVVLQYLLHLAALGAVHPENRRLFQFGLVGLSGVGVNLGILYLVHGRLGLTDLIAVPVAVEASILSNFLLNDLFTFRDRRHHHVAKRLLMFNTVSLLALVVNFTTYVIATRAFHLHYIPAALLAIVVAFSANYVGNLNWTYGGEGRVSLRRNLKEVSPWLPFFLIVLSSVALYFHDLDDPRGIYFDEHYYVTVGHQIVQGTWFDPCWDGAAGGPRPLNYEHPPLAKLIIAGSIKWFEDDPPTFEGCRKDENPNYQPFVDELAERGNPYAWRGPSAAMGVLTVVFTGLAAGRLFRSPVAAAFGSGFVALDNLVLSSSRIALLDIFATGFTMGAVYYATDPTRKGVVMTGVMLGLGFASKYTVVFAGVPVLFLTLWTHWRHGVLRPLRFDGILASILLFPLGIWIACNMPWIWMLAQDGGVGYAVSHFFDVTKAAVEWGAAGNAAHEYASAPIMWFLLSRPVWYYVRWDVDPGEHSFIYAVGNPVLWWLGAFAMLAGVLLYVVVLLVRGIQASGVPGPYGVLGLALRRVPADVKAYALASLLPLMAYGSFFLLQRTGTFIFYMTLIAPMLAFALAGALAVLWRRGGAWGPMVAIVLALFVAAGFLHFYPVTAGEPAVTMDQYEQILIDTVPTMDPCPRDPGGAFADVCPATGPLR